MAKKNPIALAMHLRGQKKGKHPDKKKARSKNACRKWKHEPSASHPLSGRPCFNHLNGWLAEGSCGHSFNSQRKVWQKIQMAHA